MTGKAAGEPGGTLPVTRFSTDALPARDRYDAWRVRTLPSLGRLYETTPLVAFDVRTRSMALGALSLTYSHMSAQEWDRTPQLVRTDGVDLVMTNIRFAGDGQGEADGRAFRAPPGSIVLSDFARPQTHVSENSYSAVMALPRRLAARVLPDVRHLHGLVIPPAPSTLLRSHLLELGEVAHTLPADAAERLGRVAIDLLAVAVAQMVPTRPPAASALATAARRRAEAAIETRLGSASLTVANLCRWSGVSRSTLYRLFERDGGVQAFIRTRRLERVADELRGGAGGRIADIAERWGFCDAAYLARVFRETHGMTPGDYRAGHDTAMPDAAPGVRGLVDAT